MVEEGDRAADSTIEAWGEGKFFWSFNIKNQCLLPNIIALIVVLFDNWFVLVVTYELDNDKMIIIFNYLITFFHKVSFFLRLFHALKSDQNYFYKRREWDFHSRDVSKILLLSWDLNSLQSWFYFYLESRTFGDSIWTIFCK